MAGTLDRAWAVCQRLDADFNASSERQLAAATLLTGPTRPSPQPLDDTRCYYQIGDHHECRLSVGHSGMHRWWASATGDVETAARA